MKELLIAKDTPNTNGGVVVPTTALPLVNSLFFGQFNHTEIIIFTLEDIILNSDIFDDDDDDGQSIY